MEKTREEAERKGQKQYYTGYLCQHLHLAPRWTSDGKCIECRAEAEKGKEVQNKEKGVIAKEVFQKRNITSKKKAHRAWRKWTPEEIDIATSVDGFGRYVYDINEAAEMLGRSLISISGARRRYADGKKKLRKDQRI